MLETSPWLTGSHFSNSVASEEKETEPGRTTTTLGLDTQMTDYDPQGSGQFGSHESGLEQSASQLSIVDSDGGATGEESDEVDLIANTRDSLRFGKAEISDSAPGNSFFEDESFDFAAHAQNQAQAARGAVYEPELAELECLSFVQRQG